MLDALFGFVFDIVLSAVGVAIAKVCGADNADEAGPVIIGLGLIAIGVAVALWGH
jgi:hypothetical protein